MLEGKPWSPDVRRHPLLAYSVSRRQSLGKEVVKPSLTMRLNVSGRMTLWGKMGGTPAISYATSDSKF